MCNSFCNFANFHSFPPEIFPNYEGNFNWEKISSEIYSQRNFFEGGLVSNQFIYNQNYYKLKNREKINSLMPNQPYLKITVMKSNGDCDSSNIDEYFVTPKGMIKSEKNTDTEDIIIGRQHATAQGIRPNDIVLPVSDRAISRIHCKISYRDGFKTNRPITQEFLALLMMGHKRLGANSSGRFLPPHLFRLVYEFAKKPKKFYLIDIGSVFGTYIKLKNNNSYILEKGQAYLIGADILFTVNDISSAHSNKEKNLGTDFLTFLANEKSNGVEIHGLKPFECEILEKLMQNRNKENLFESINEETVVCGSNNNQFPFVKIEFQNISPQIPQTHIFVCTSNDNQDIDFKLGRSQDCDIVINHNTISRKQCRINFSPNSCKWSIWDGDSFNKKESANGTWLSLTDFRVKKERVESDQKEIEHGTEIKISDSILKVLT